jgi:hypothetical protein
MRLAPFAGAAALLLAACSEQSPQPPPGEQAGPYATAGSRGDAELALGLTERQLLDADLIAADGTELGDVEGLVRDADGSVTHLLVEIEDSSPDRYVHVPTYGLERIADGSGWDVRADLTRDQLMAMPEVRR